MNVLLKKITGVLFLIGLLSTSGAQAQTPARVYLERVGNFGARVLIDSPEPVNAYDIRITFDDTIATVDSIDSSRSIITVLPSPIKASDGEIILKGGSTRSFSGNGGELLTVQLRPVAAGVVQFTIPQATAYLADGKGTPLALQTNSLPLRVTNDSLLAYTKAKTDGQLGAADQKPPELTTVEIQANPLQYGERLLVFQAMDKETGIARYEARERSWLTWSAWREALNPYPLDSGAWAIQIKAVDYNENIALATVYQLGNAIWKALLGILLVALALLGIKAIIGRHRSGV